MRFNPSTEGVQVAARHAERVSTIERRVPSTERRSLPRSRTELACDEASAITALVLESQVALRLLARRPAAEAYYPEQGNEAALQSARITQWYLDVTCVATAFPEERRERFLADAGCDPYFVEHYVHL